MNFSLEYPIGGEKLPEDLKNLCEFICELNEELAKIPLPQRGFNYERKEILKRFKKPIK